MTHHLHTLAEQVVTYHTAHNTTISTAESCTGGMIAATLTNISGASTVYVASTIAYANQAKTRLLQVGESLIITHGAVSAEVAEAMACGGIRQHQTDYCIAVTGIAGPGGGTTEKPVGLVYICLNKVKNADKRDRPLIEKHLWSGSREAIRSAATARALELLANPEHYLSAHS